MSIFPAAVEDRRSAGRAWLMSIALPGAGQLYLGATARGLASIAVTIVAAAVMIFAEGDPRWFAMRTLVFFYAFGALDAYLTAVQRNQGIEVEAPANPRVAALLNFTTNGFGYLYLGHKKAGILIVLGIALVTRVLAATVPLLAEVVVLALAIHAAQLAVRERRESYPPERLAPATPSKLPVAVPYVVAGFLLLLYYGLVTLGQVALIREQLRS